MLKYYIANLSLRINEMDTAGRLSQEILNVDIKEYYGHMQSELTIEPMLIVLNQKFDTLMSQLKSGTNPTEEQKNLFIEV